MPTRSVHRILGSLAGLLLLYLGVTGTITQLVDLRAIVSHAPATDPDMVAIRESLDGPGNFAVIAPGDYGAPALPAGFDYARALGFVVHARAELPPQTPLKFVEFRVVAGTPVGQALWGDRLMRFDAATGHTLQVPHGSPGGGPPPASAHQSAKRWHRLWVLGDDMLWLDALAGMALFVMTVTGLIVYFRLLSGRGRAGRAGPFWRGGGLLKQMHRWVSVSSAVVLMIVAVSGMLLSIDSFMLGLYRLTHPTMLVHGNVPVGMVADYSRPMQDRELAPMLSNTLSGSNAVLGKVPMKALRLRYFSGMAQGVVVTGDTGTARQTVFNADTGRRVTMSEPFYPDTVFPFGWDEHEFMKRLHRGDALGLPGRFLDLFAGLSLVFLSVSGLAIYLDLWRRRRRAGRTSPVWK